MRGLNRLLVHRVRELGWPVTEELLLQDACVGDNLLPIADDLPCEVAALTEPLAVALHSVNRAEAEPGDKAVVFGCGPIGLGISRRR